MKRPPSYLVDSVWAGTEASLQEFLQAQEGLQEQMRAGNNQDDGEDGVPYLLSIDGAVATLSIHGSLTNRDSWYNRYFGIVSYGAIREAMVYAATDPNVKHIVLDINSGGGAVNGVADTANLIRLVSNKVKPVTSYSDGAMCSAAYWLGCSAGETYASNISTVGSIGVITTHMEYSKQLKDAGVTPTVMRAGKYKALVNSVEPLTEEAKAQMQSQLEAVYAIFTGHVSTMTDRPLAYVESVMADGREFLGEQALKAGLVDGIKTYDNLMSDIKESTTQPHYGATPRNPAQGPTTMKHKQALTDQQIAALAEGGLSAGTPAVKTDEELAAETLAATEAATALAETEAATAAAALVATAAATPATGTQSAEVISYLQTQVKDKDAAILTAAVETSTLKAKLADFEASVGGLVEIAAKSTSNMQIALGGSAFDSKGVTAVEVLAAHQKASTQFQAKFKAGGVAAVDAAAAPKDESNAALDPMRQARLAAASTSPKSK